MHVRNLAATLGLAALAVLGALSLSHTAAPSDASATARRAAHATYIPPTVPKMRLGVTLGEPTTTVPAHHKS